MMQKKTTSKKDKVQKIEIVDDNESTKKDIVISETQVPMSTFASADMLLQQLAGKDVDVDKMEKILALKGKYEAEENKKKYQREFSKLQSSLPVIQKTKSVKTRSGDIAYKYAPLEKIIEQIKPVMREFGFSYRWSEGISESDSCKRIWCHIMAHGHEEKSFVDIPTLDTNQLTNKAQMAGSASTYGKRYSLIGALGIMADEDDDGRGAGTVDNTPKIDPNIITKEEGVKMSEAMKKLAWDNKKLGEFIQFSISANKQKWSDCDDKEKRLVYDLILEQVQQISNENNS